MKINHLQFIVLSCMFVGSCSKSSPPPPPPAAPAKPAAPAAGAAPVAAAAAVAPEKKNPLDFLKAPGEEYYRPSGRRDPFKPFEGGNIIFSAVNKAPLEQFEINQLELTAIVWGIPRPKVLFRAPDGYSYIAQIGTGIGRNRGKISRITKNKVLISEEFRDPSGEYVARESEFVMEDDQDSQKLFNEMELKYSDE